MEKLKSAIEWAKGHKTIILYAVGIILVAVLAVVAWRYTHPPQTVTTEIQTQAETPTGVEQAANRAHVPISNDQAQQAASQIKYIYSHDVQPIYTITTNGNKVQKVAETAQNNAGADFSIITDKSAPNSKVDVSAIPSTSTVELNQYNVQAYKKTLHTIEVVPDIQNKSVDEVGYMVSRKISNDGKYIGVGASYNIDDHKTMIKMSYTW